MGILRLVSKKLPANRQWKRSEEKELEKGKEMRSDEGGNEIDSCTCCNVLAGTSPTYRKKKGGPLIRSSRSPLFKAVGRFVLLPSFLFRVVTKRGCIFSCAICSGCLSLWLSMCFAFILSLL